MPGLTPTPAELEVAEILDNIRRVFQVVNEQSKKVEKETGLTGPQAWAIMTIARLGPLSLTSLARRMYLHPATVGGILDRLEKRGLVARTRSEEDRRVVEITLTEEGMALVEHSPEVATSTIARGLETLPQQERAEIMHGLEKLVTILGAQGVPPRLIGAEELNVSKED
ncbi:MarR family winged helix-turn-helix transcriptional regulator [Geobacter sp. DSM 9736]|uniref:MarR family winged helix-turn-helix transcriptional regulator n=1 Tax=Geobacter sp. DSM 9736 TaxID=1277350 RepID=UPI000B4FD6AF|nr:MarR family transcriptional regulator [Geobacter sp. DSM 9736]SNB45346.1 transcriptional regulator, MarR family [Geobacter sp. DSM 9736]